MKRFDSTDACLSHLEKHGFVSVVTSPHIKGKTSVFLHEGDYTQHTKLAVWFGNEKRGISTLAVERSEMCVAIPMFGMIESQTSGPVRVSFSTKSRNSDVNIRANSAAEDGRENALSHYLL